jgi:hypothetical protein
VSIYQKGFKFHIEKIKYFSNIYTVNFKNMKKKGYRRKTTFEKKRSHMGCLGHGLTRQVDQVLSGCRTGQSFNKPESV